LSDVEDHVSYAWSFYENGPTLDQKAGVLGDSTAKVVIRINHASISNLFEVGERPPNAERVSYLTFSPAEVEREQRSGLSSPFSTVRLSDICCPQVEVFSVFEKPPHTPHHH